VWDGGSSYFLRSINSRTKLFCCEWTPTFCVQSQRVAVWLRRNATANDISPEHETNAMYFGDFLVQRTRSFTLDVVFSTLQRPIIILKSPFPQSSLVFVPPLCFQWPSDTITLQPSFFPSSLLAFRPMYEIENTLWLRWIMLRCSPRPASMVACLGKHYPLAFIRITMKLRKATFQLNKSLS